jgi:hypothetical protein
MDRAVELVRDALENNVEVTAFTLGLAHWVVASVVWSISRKVNVRRESIFSKNKLPTKQSVDT